jgi:transposase
MNDELDAIYSRTGRDSIPPERLLRASLIQTLHSIRSECALVEHLEYNLLYRWFVGLGMDEKVWHHSTFSANRDLLLNERVAACSSTRYCAWPSGKACSRTNTSRWTAP